MTRTISMIAPTQSSSALFLVARFDAGDAETYPLACSSEVPVPGDQDNFLVAKFECGGEMNRVVASQAQVFG